MNYSDYTTFFATGVATEASGLFAMALPSTWDGILKLLVIILISLFSKFASLYIEKHWGQKPIQDVIIEKGDSIQETSELKN